MTGDPALGTEVSTEGLEGLECEWCREPVELKIPVLRNIKGKKVGKIATGMHVYVCGKHEEVGRKVANNERSERQS